MPEMGRLIEVYLGIMCYPPTTVLDFIGCSQANWQVARSMQQKDWNTPSSSIAYYGQSVPISGKINKCQVHIHTCVATSAWV